MRLPDPHSSYALLIGTSTYSSLTDLPAVRNNLEALAGILTDPALVGLRPDHCIVVHDPVEVRTVYRTLLHYAKLEPTDTLLVYFAGHGRTDLRNDLYFALADTATEELRVSALSFDIVRDLLTESRAKNKVLILDCCFSGRAIPDMGGTDDAIVGQLGIEGTYTLTATPANAVALAPTGATYTAFTGELLALLRTGVPDGPQLLTFATIYHQLLHALNARGLPRPGQRGTGTIDQLALSRNPAHPANSAPIPMTDSTRNRVSSSTFHEDGDLRFPVRKGIGWQMVQAVIGLIGSLALRAVSVDPGTTSPEFFWFAATLMGLVTVMALVGAISLSRKAFELQIGPRGMELTFAGRRTRYMWDEISRVTIRRIRGKGMSGVLVYPLPGTPLPHGGIGLWTQYLPRMERKTGWILIVPTQLLKVPQTDIERALTRYSAGRFQS
ncbi:caspase family protein [Nocardia pneumoniae]|uniref:caspase family protein n=1 Tax=Nocardia pneumoniae TaxID=228601 RepID=UPI000301AC4D|nr:caspase family protein [Nocardia pneumoniae]